MLTVSLVRYNTKSHFSMIIVVSLTPNTTNRLRAPIDNYVSPGVLLLHTSQCCDQVCQLGAVETCFAAALENMGYFFVHSCQTHH